MKKWLSMLIVSILVLSMGTTASAMEPQTESTTSGSYTSFTKVQERIASRQAEIEQRRQEVADFKAAAQEKSALVKAAREENIALLQTNTNVRKQLAQIYADMKKSGTTLDASTLEQIGNYNQQIRDIIDELVASKGSIKNYLDTNKESLRSLDYAVLESMYADIAEIQSWRNEQLSEINRALGEILALIQKIE